MPFRIPIHGVCVRLLTGLAAFILPFLLILSAHAEAPLTAGFQTLGIWKPDSRLRLDVALWYPSRRAPSNLTYDDWQIRAARNAPPLPGQHPLILLSHDTGGSRFTLHFLAEALARSGFVVAAPTHNGDSMDDMRNLFTMEQISNRAIELSALLDYLLQSEQAAMIDATRVGVAGVGPGASAALLLAGGRLDGAGWPGYCRRAGGADPYCSPWALPRLNSMSEAIMEQSPSFADPRVKAVVLAAPSYGMFFSRRSLSSVRVPVLLLRADLDNVNRAPHHAESIQASLPTPPTFAVLEKTDRPSLMAPCSPALLQMLPDLCTPVPEADSDHSRRQFADRTARFLISHLGQAKPAP